MNLSRSLDGRTVHTPTCPLLGSRVPWLWALDKTPAQVRAGMEQGGSKPCRRCRPAQEDAPLKRRVRAVIPLPDDTRLAADVELTHRLGATVKDTSGREIGVITGTRSHPDGIEIEFEID